MTLSNEGYSLKVEADINAWLNRSPAQGCKLSINVSQAHITAIYSSISDSGEHLTRLIDNDATDEVMMLKENFNITKREDDVFLWLAKGKANREIALILDMSPRTVNKHLEQLFKKLGVGNRTSAAALAIQYLQKSWVISE